MSAATLRPSPQIEYPDEDGNPIAENTLQFDWIYAIKGSLETLFHDHPDVFVAGDLLWYPVQGEPTIRTAPDTMVVFGRPKGRRGSYMQWVEDGIAPQVAFEVLSPGNRAGEMARKLAFYERYGIEEYYVFDPDDQTMAGYLRDEDHLRKILDMDGWESPRLGIHFEKCDGEWRFLLPDGRPFQTFVEVAIESAASSARAEQATMRADQATMRADRAKLRAERERERADTAEAQKQVAEENLKTERTERRKAETERRKAEEATRKAAERAERLAAKLREMGIEPDTD